MNEQALLDHLRTLGVHAAAGIDVVDMPFNRCFRALCESNACGNFGQCWMCPPEAGDIDALIAQAKTFSRAIVYQTVGTLEDSYDFEGMMAAGKRHNDLAQRISSLLTAKNILHLGAGGCRVCEICAKRTGEPCRFPEQAMASLETYGVAVSELAARCGMTYINGQNTVTFFGAVFCME